MRNNIRVSEVQTTMYKINKPKGYIVQHEKYAFLGPEDLLGKKMAIHSSALAWRIPWMEEPARLQSTGSQRARHD